MLAYSWNVSRPSVTEAAPRVRTAATLDPLGSGIIRPFRRTERADFANASGAPEVMSCVGQILGTPKGTFPWRPDFGCDVERLRHKDNTPILADTARVVFDEALRKWEPRVQLVSVKVPASDRRPGNVLTFEITMLIGGKQRTLTLSF